MIFFDTHCCILGIKNKSLWSSERAFRVKVATPLVSFHLCCISVIILPPSLEHTGECLCSHASTQFLGVDSRIWYYFRLIPNRPDGKYCTLLLRWPNGHVTLEANVWSGIPPVTGSLDRVPGIRQRWKTCQMAPSHCSQTLIRNRPSGEAKCPISCE